MVQGEEEEQREVDPCQPHPGVDLCQLRLETVPHSVVVQHLLQGEGCPLLKTGQTRRQQDLKIHLPGIRSMVEPHALPIE